MAEKKKIAVFVSGSGTNLQAIIDAEIPTLDIALVFCNVPGARAIERAALHGIPCEVLSHKDYDSREEYESAVLKCLEPYGIDLIVLAGFMRILSPVLVGAYKGRILNIHPALLPSFPGVHSARQALDYGVKYTGVTVHFVDEGVDTGPIILQEVVEISDDDTEESLLEKIHSVEHEIYPRALRLVTEGNYEIKGRRVVFLS